MLRAAADLVEEIGYVGVTVEGVADRAKAAKSTIYRWWRSKAALVMDAYGHAVASRMPNPDTGSVARDLTEFVDRLYGVVEYPMRVKALRGLMAEAQLDPDFEAPFRDWVLSRRAVVTALLARGVDRGELSATLDLDHAADLVFGPFWYRLLVGHAALVPEQAQAQVARLLAGLSGGVPSATNTAPQE